MPPTKPPISGEVRYQAAEGYLVVSPWSLDSVGGVTTAILGLHDGLLRRSDVRPSLLVNDWRSLRASRGEQAGRQLWRLRMPDIFAGRHLHSWLFNVLVRLPVSTYQLLRILRADRIRAVNVHYPSVTCLGFVALRILGLYRGKLLLSFHGQDLCVVAMESRRMHKWAWRLIFAYADRIVACSSRLADEAATIPWIDLAKVCFVNNGVDVWTLESISDRAEYVPSAEPPLVCLATYEHKKGLDVLLRAWKIVRDTIPSASLTIAGRREAHASTIESLLADLGLAHNVRLLYDLPHEEAISLLRKSAGLVLPSRREPFGLVLLEAAALGVPVVFTDVCGASAVLPSRLVSMVPPEDHIALAAAIIDLLQHRSEALTRASRLRHFVLENLSWDNAAARYLRLAYFPSPD